MLQAQADRFQSGPSCRVHPANRRRPSPQLLLARSEGVRVRLNRHHSNCYSGCPCVCHASQKAITPGFLDHVFGQLFIGYTDLPLLSSKCDKEECTRSQTPLVSVEYWFPLGFCWSLIVRLQLGYQPNVGPQMSLSTLRRVPDTAACVTFALNGDIEGLKDLFVRGLASPRDVSNTRGYSILRVSRSNL